MSLYKEFSTLFPYLQSVRKIQEYLSFDVSFPNSWKLPKKFVDETKVMEQESKVPNQRMFSFVSEIDEISVGKTSDNIQNIIKYNIEREEKESDLEFAVSGDWYQEQLDDLENSIGDLESKIQSINENMEVVGMEEVEVEKKEEAEPKLEKKKVKKESLDSDLAEIDTQAGIVAMEAKLDRVSEMISAKMERLKMIDEDANLADLVDKGKMKEMQKEIKVLEKTKAKMEAMYGKMTGGKKYTKEEIVDESAIDNE